MKALTEEQKNDDLVKSLLESGFEEEAIAGWIESGSIILEKSVPDNDDDDVDKDLDDDDDAVDKDKKSDDDDDDADEDDKGKGGKIEKGISDAIVKSIQGAVQETVGELEDSIAKSIGNSVAEALKPFADNIEKSLEGMRSAIVAFGNTAPSFKTAALSKAVIEKSIQTGGGQKDEDDKVVLSVTRDRSVVRELIAKSIEEESDTEIQKSLRDNTTAYLLDPVEGAIGEVAARYMYDKKNIRLVK